MKSHVLIGISITLLLSLVGAGSNYFMEGDPAKSAVVALIGLTIGCAVFFLLSLGGDEEAQ